MALARYVLDTPSAVASRRVLDFGSGCGLAAIAAAMAGAAFVQAFDIDPLATTMQQLNAELNSVAFESRCADPLDGEGFIDRQVSKNPVHGELSDLDVIFAGDVCYDRESSARVTAWLRRQANQGATVLLADPGRHYVPSDGLELLATYDVPVLTELESTTHKRTLLWRLTPEQAEEDDY
jgi:predicted nicotinamide N-methyase